MMKKIVGVIVSLCICLVVEAQIYIKSTEQQFIEDVVKNGLFISKQSFQICDRETGELFGLNGKKEFGVQYSIGVKIPDGIVLTDKAVRPWLYNNKFGKYRQKYDPVFYQATFSEMTDKVKYDSLDYTLAELDGVVDTTIYKFSSGTFDGNGFALDGTIGKKEGWIVWITAKKDHDFEQSANLNYTIYRKTITIDADKQSFDISKPNLEQNILGGIYVVPVYTKIGVIEFRLCGIVSLVDDGWKIYCPFVGMKGEEAFDEAPGDTEVGSDEPSELTPVKDMGKEKAKDKKKKKK